MVVLGVDAHKATHTIVAVDGNGCQLAQRTVFANEAGHLEALRWAGQFGERSWALEDCRHLTRRLERELLVAGERVVRVPPKLMAGARRGARTRGKSDPIDALAVARACQREPDLPVAVLDGPARELRLLVDHREDLIAERTRAQNRLRWHLHELGLEHLAPSRALNRFVVLDRLAATLTDDHVVGGLARELVGRCRSLTVEINALARRIELLVRGLAPSLIGLPGCGALTAAKILGEVGDITRFKNRGAFAMHTGTAPVPVWSGNTERHRLNRGGNRQLNCALHRIAITQMQRPGPARDYLDHRLATGNTKTEAIRALRRHLSNIVYQRLRDDAHHPVLARAA